MDFKAKYNRDVYLNFFRHQFLPDDFEKTDEKLSDFKPDRIKSAVKIGEVPSLELIVLEVRHESENDPRISLSRETFRLLANYGKQRALVIFTSKNSDNFRLSLVTIDLKWEQGHKPAKEYSNPKRFSFFLGPDAKTHTPEEYLIGKGKTKDFDDLKNRFSIEIVTKDFYKEYAQVFGEIEKAVAANNKLSAEELRLYTQVLMNRLMFLRFLEKKKWVKFGDSADYLANLYAARGLNNQSFFQNRLCPLFFEALAIEGKQESKAVGQTVFLNGGLFEKGELDNKVKDIPDEAFKNLLNTEGLFYKFNFTVEESTPIDIEVAVDPEMLGKVFEELVTGRHESGSYYTPRPIVSFMCREALKGYLAAKTSASKKAIELLIDEHQIAEDLTNKHAEEILFYLETLKAIDPACGSGAYLLGLLQELIEIRKALQNQQLKADPDFIYKLKLRLISHCLYGVDIDPFATNIAKLRLWLSLSVEADTPQPLPNLDFKIETGDSILGPCDIFSDRSDALVMSALRQKAEQLVLKKDRFMLAHGNEKSTLYKEIKAEEDAIAQEAGTIVGKGVIAWQVHFAEVFTRGRKCESTMKGEFGFMADAHKQKAFKITTYEPGGFDIVLANPPYVRQELIKNIKPKLKEIYPKTYMGTADLYTYFYTRAVELLASSGMLVFISPNKWFRANYGKNLRKYIAENCTVSSITDFGELPVFEGAATFPMIFVAQKQKSKQIPVFTQVKSLESPYPDVLSIIKQSGQPLPTDAVKGSDWKLTDSSSAERLRKMESKGIPLQEYVDGQICVGVKTGFNQAFWLDNEQRVELIKADPKSDEIIKHLVVGDSIRKWTIRDQNKWLIFTRQGINIDKYPAVKRHLQQFRKELEPRPRNWATNKTWSGRKPGTYKWHEIQDSVAYFQEFEKSKIVYPDIAKEPRFALDKDNSYVDMTGFIIPRNDLYLLGVLNSSAAWDYLCQTAAVLGDAEKGGRIRLKRIYVSKLPIPNPSAVERNAIAKLVQKCLDAKGVGCEKLEAQINEMVYKLYDLTPEEIAIVEGKI